MKRSDILKSITNVLDSLADMQEVSFNDIEDYADIVLSNLEEQGMLPPSRTFKMGNMEVTDNSWEPEDEK
jgi:hypothetical protein